jgi:hypothetical protein
MMPVKGGEKTKGKILMIILISAAMACLLLVGIAHAIYDETTIIESKWVDVYANQDPPFYAELKGNLSSWYHVRILPTHVYEWEWITFNPGQMTSNVSGSIFIQMPTYITISSWNLTMRAPWNYSGGVGYYWIYIVVFGSGFGSFTLTTNYIPSNYYGIDIQFNVTATAGTSVNNTIYWLQT